MDKQMGKDRELTRATELGYICSWRSTPWALPLSTEGSLENAHNCSPAMAAGTRCQRDPARAALQHQLDRLNLHQRDPASTVRGCLSCGPCTRYVWATVLSAVEVLFLPYPGLGLRRKHSAPTQSSIPPELEQHH